MKKCIEFNIDDKPSERDGLRANSWISKPDISFAWRVRLIHVSYRHSSYTSIASQCWSYYYHIPRRCRRGMFWGFWIFRFHYFNATSRIPARILQREYEQKKQIKQVIFQQDYAEKIGNNINRSIRDNKVYISETENSERWKKKHEKLRCLYYILKSMSVANPILRNIFSWIQCKSALIQKSLNCKYASV